MVRVRVRVTVRVRVRVRVRNTPHFAVSFSRCSMQHVNELMEEGVKLGFGRARVLSTCKFLLSHTPTTCTQISIPCGLAFQPCQMWPTAQ